MIGTWAVIFVDYTLLQPLYQACVTNLMMEDGDLDSPLIPEWLVGLWDTGQWRNHNEITYGSDENAKARR